MSLAKEFRFSVGALLNGGGLTYIAHSANLSSSAFLREKRIDLNLNQTMCSNSTSPVTLLLRRETGVSPREHWVQIPNTW